jgi:prepilin-type N-terminal cleavage/methylation domain-containing protein
MKSRGFTLVEILVAVALIGLVFVAMNTLLFSMGELWGRGGEKHLFELHVRNVSRFLEQELRRAGLPPGGVGDKLLAVQDVRTEGGRTETVLLFPLPKGSRLCEWPDRPLPDVICALSLREREGLFLLWHSRWEERYTDDPPREVLITPWATGLSYDYYDADFKNWKTETTLRKESSGTGVVPQRIRLKFAYDGYEQETVIPLPEVARGVPLL